jgi:hypothetical protein
MTSNPEVGQMKRRAPAVLTIALAAALVPSTAFAKGPIAASVDGPGLGAPIRFGDPESWGEEDAMAAHQPVMQLAEAAGFFPASFGQEPDPMLARKPTGALGPRYVIEYLVPGPNNTEDRITQDLYPYAKPNPVTYTAPGQPFFETQATRGGWYAATNPSVPPLTFVLTEAGLPNGSEFPWTVVATLALLGALLAVGFGARLHRRRQPAGGQASA